MSKNKPTQAEKIAESETRLQQAHDALEGAQSAPLNSETRSSQQRAGELDQQTHQSSALPSSALGLAHTQQAGMAYYPPIQARYQEDEISLVDILRVFKRRKRLWCWLTVVCVLLAVCLASYRRPHLQYQQIVQLPAISSMATPTIYTPLLSFSNLNAEYTNVIQQKWGEDKAPYAKALHLKSISSDKAQVQMTYSSRHTSVIEQGLVAATRFIQQQSAAQIKAWRAGVKAQLANYDLQLKGLKKQLAAVAGVTNQAQEMLFANTQQQMQTIEQSKLQLNWQLAHMLPYQLLQRIKQPVGLSIAAGMVLAILLGLFFAAMLTLMVEFVAKLRRKLAD